MCSIIEQVRHLKLENEKAVKKMVAFAHHSISYYKHFRDMNVTKTTNITI